MLWWDADSELYPYACNCKTAHKECWMEHKRLLYYEIEKGSAEVAMAGDVMILSDREN